MKQESLEPDMSAAEAEEMADVTREVLLTNFKGPGAVKLLVTYSEQAYIVIMGDNPADVKHRHALGQLPLGEWGCQNKG